jgi:hypothetical protein
VPGTDRMVAECSGARSKPRRLTVRWRHGVSALIISPTPTPSRQVPGEDSRRTLPHRSQSVSSGYALCECDRPVCATSTAIDALVSDRVARPAFDLCMQGLGELLMSS